MTASKTIYSEAMKKGHEAAWEGQWTTAIAEYRRAVQQAPQDLTGHLSLAHALEEDGHLKAALEECEACSRLRPGDPETLLRAANLQEQLGLLSEAAGTFLAIADIRVAAKVVDKAVEMWQRAAALEPSRADVHVQLAQVYEKSGRRVQAGKEYVALSRIYQRRGDRGKALAMAQKALTIDPQNPAAKSLGEEMKPREPAEPDGEPGTLDVAQNAAIFRLAETVLADDWSSSETLARDDNPARPETLLSATDVDALVVQGVDALASHRAVEAIQIFRRLADAGVAKPDVKLNLGLLYLEVKQYDDAIAFLDQVAANSRYAVASHLALGRCYRALGKTKAAATEFLEAIKNVDLGNVRPEQALELESAYKGALESLTQAAGSDAETLVRAMESLLSATDWETQARDMRKHLEKVRGDGGQISLAEMLVIPESSLVFEHLSRSQEHLEQGHARAASDECLEAIELLPNYLPAHDQLAQILTSAGRVSEAGAKYIVLAELSSVRRDLPRAEKYYRQVLKLMPTDVAVRSRLIANLEAQGRAEAVLQEYGALAEEYCRTGSMDKAAETCEAGIRSGVSKGVDRPQLATLEETIRKIRDSGETELPQPDDRTRISEIATVEAGSIAGQYSSGQKDTAEHALDEALGTYHI